jgi:hypothetical protein
MTKQPYSGGVSTAGDELEKLNPLNWECAAVRTDAKRVLNFPESFPESIKYCTPEKRKCRNRKEESGGPYSS